MRSIIFGAACLLLWSMPATAQYGTPLGMETIPNAGGAPPSAYWHEVTEYLGAYHSRDEFRHIIVE